SYVNSAVWEALGTIYIPNHCKYNIAISEIVICLAGVLPKRYTCFKASKCERSYPEKMLKVLFAKSFAYQAKEYFSTHLKFLLDMQHLKLR
ncbi:hypothetical protein KAU55_01720, partial [Candidatus Bathyarchaeota archaeon]|nr:hypothetical protein [Candidatus Bathyarchaeota archaeon]